MVPYARALRLQIADVSINATADAVSGRVTQTEAILAGLVPQLVVRILCAITMVSLLSSSRSWRDEFLLQFCGVFGVWLVGLIAALFLRVYRVMLASFPSRFPSVLDYWNSTEYSLLLAAHTLLSLLFYYYTIHAAHRMGSARYFSIHQNPGRSGRPSVLSAVHMASRRST